MKLILRGLLCPSDFETKLHISNLASACHPLCVLVASPKYLPSFTLIVSVGWQSVVLGVKSIAW